MQPILPISSFFGFLVVLSRSRIFKASYFLWSILPIILCLPLDSLYGNCGFLSALADFGETLFLVVEGFFSFAFNDWRDDLILSSLL